MVLAFCVDNDFDDNVRGTVLRLEGDRLVPAPGLEARVRRARSPGQRIARFVFGHSHLALFVREHLTRIRAKLLARRGASPAEAGGLPGPPPAGSPDQRLAITTRIVDSLHAVTRRAGVPLVVLMIPSYCQYDAEGWRAARLPDRAPQLALAARLRPHLDSLGVVVVDPLDRLLAGSRERRLHFMEGHFNAEGSRLVGRAVAEGIVAAGVVPGARARGR